MRKPTDNKPLPDDPGPEIEPNLPDDPPGATDRAEGAPEAAGSGEQTASAADDRIAELEKALGEARQKSETLSANLEAAGKEAKAARLRAEAFEEKLKEAQAETLAARRRADAAEKTIDELGADEPEQTSAVAELDVIGRLAPGTMESPGEGRISDDLARLESVDPWYHAEATVFRSDSAYDRNMVDRAKASVERAFKPGRLGEDAKGIFTALPAFNPLNRLVVIVAILPPVDQGE
jgi:regulator of replication initiation timing